MLGRAPIVDFDGTLARLDVDWDGLRRRLGLGSLNDLWETRGSRRDGWMDDAGWRAVTAAEIDAARDAEPVAPMVAALPLLRRLRGAHRQQRGGGGRLSRSPRPSCAPSA